MQLKGFTFIEVIVVVSIMLIVGATSGWFAIQFWPEKELVSSAQLVRTSLGQAALYAQTGRLGSDWGVTQNGGNLIIFSGTSYIDRDPLRDEVMPLPQGIVMNGLNEAIFTAPEGTTMSRAISVEQYGRTISLTVNKYGIITFHE